MQTQNPEVRKYGLKNRGLATPWHSQIDKYNYLGTSQLGVQISSRKIKGAQQ